MQKLFKSPLIEIWNDFLGLLINSIIPMAWAGFAATRKFRGATYHIKVTLENGEYEPGGGCFG